ncbi:WW domain-containing adapter protein with coiled-coil-like isoform X2 [Watersipora subatra]|uniref:WW domain-containing adapter protein with coiled-coil-like isoform X2 n=1 Tax=Watersipora subatra TaxID=2589382 RepID=UPI00355AD230
MVMHARKLSRIDDGYYDCHDYHELKNTNGERKIPRDRRIRDEHGMISDRHGSPTFRHKHIQNDRRKLERDRHEKYTHESEHRAKEDLRFGDNYMNSADGLSINRIEDYKSVDTSAESGVATHLKDKDSLQKSEDYKKSSSSTKSYTGSSKDPRTEAQKTALRVFGDWSEHVSSSGKRYFYNCKTEVSQWVRPKEWKIDDLARQGRPKPLPKVTSKGGEEVQRNGIATYDEHTDSPSRPRSDKNSDSKHSTVTDNRSKMNDLKPNTYQKSTSSSNSDVTLNEQTAGGREVNNYKTLRRSHDRSSSVTSTPSSSIMDTSAASPNNSLQVNQPAAGDRVALYNGNNDGSGDDMDISPDISPKQSSDVHNGDEKSLKTGNAAKANDRSKSTTQQTPNPDQSMIWGKALQTLQTLQEVLERSRGAPPQVGCHAVRTAADSPRSATSQSSPRLNSLPAQQTSSSIEITDSSQSGQGEKSPAASEASLGQHSALSSAAESSSGVSVALPQSLVNFYDAALVSHISNWPAEQIEMRAHLAYRDGLVICGHHCGQVSTELKRDRSHVRIAEVQSTLIEHRILFLKQQISELETQEKTFSSGQT